MRPFKSIEAEEFRKQLIAWVMQQDIFRTSHLITYLEVTTEERKIWMYTAIKILKKSGVIVGLERDQYQTIKKKLK